MSDGTVNVEKDYLYKIEQLGFRTGVPHARKRLQDAGFLLVVVTNQSAGARGYYNLNDADDLHRYMRDVQLKAVVALTVSMSVPITRLKVSPTMCSGARLVAKARLACCCGLRQLEYRHDRVLSPT